MASVLIKHGEVYTEQGILYDTDLLISDGRIAAMGRGLAASNRQTIIIDAKGKKVVPGFIDIHIHGGVGCDTMDAGYEALNNISLHLARHGVTAFLATTMTMDKDSIMAALQNIGQTMAKDTQGAELLGAYVEGPFISAEHKGAQDEKFILPPDKQLLDDLIAASSNRIKVIALAPEKDKDGDFVRYATSQGLKVSLGHTNATYAEMSAAVEHGATLAVHTYNGMRGFTHREPGALGAVWLDDRLYSELICDFIHSHRAAVQILLRMKGTDKVVLISDGMPASGLGDGEYMFGGQKVIVRDNTARIETGSLAGSTLTLDRAVANIVSLGYPLAEAVRMAALNPAKAVGIDDRKGSLKIGKDGDVVLLDSDLTIHATVVKGKVVFRAAQ